MTVTVTGRVETTTGQPLPNAHVIVIKSNGDAEGMVASPNGIYEVNADVGDSIEVSYVGFQDQSWTVPNEGEQQNKVFVMQEASEQVGTAEVVAKKSYTKWVVMGAAALLLLFIYLKYFRN